ncbi:MAG: type II toxin-antitoxin system VapC family toxin [Ignavibacterium sp.]|nr:type II toxin-antitoxin system VapC family toxin [Ignavibacterium sp.]MCX7611339.1 type II toxin-antitoxin system VapC family toxin [Ignavibacterium sp.]MDW8374765.1 type II toxin-antitoxin system VapC family toxin [Ignavibacteriales bacterium]
MRFFFDSSAFAKRFVEEPGSDEVENLCRKASIIALSSICFPEIISALNRRLREKFITKKDYQLIKEKIFEEIEDLEIINIVPEVISTSVSLLEKNNLRTLDAIHIASAIAWKSDLFISADKRQIAAAKKSGLKVKYIE